MCHSIWDHVILNFFSDNCCFGSSLGGHYSKSWMSLCLDLPRSKRGRTLREFQILHHGESHFSWHSLNLSDPELAQPATKLWKARYGLARAESLWEDSVHELRRRLDLRGHIYLTYSKMVVFVIANASNVGSKLPQGDLVLWGCKRKFKVEDCRFWH